MKAGALNMVELENVPEKIQVELCTQAILMAMRRRETEGGRDGKDS